MGKAAADTELRNSGWAEIAAADVIGTALSALSANLYARQFETHRMVIAVAETSSQLEAVMLESSGDVASATVRVDNLAAQADAELLQAQQILAREQAAADVLRNLEARYMATLTELLEGI